VQVADTLVPPILRWVGGKQRLIRHLLQLLPDDFAERQYVEPFLGGGSMFLATRPQRARLCDANHDLMHCYEYIRDNPQAVHRQLVPLRKLNNAEDYYNLRSQFNSTAWSYKKAAIFIFLNRTCFNGIYRVNQQSQFNVPFGFKASAIFPDLSALTQLSLLLGRATLLSGDYSLSLEGLGSQSFVYLDPPYPALNGTAFFTHYTDDKFSIDDQLELADRVHSLDAMGVRFMMSNASTPLIREAFAGYRIDTLNVPRWVSCKGTKLRVDEVVIRNY
jgi:DNA adenine methylase